MDRVFALDTKDEWNTFKGARLELFRAKLEEAYLANQPVASVGIDASLLAAFLKENMDYAFTPLVLLEIHAIQTAP